MASYNLLQSLNPRFDSPAKVFAKLKSKVQKEAMSSKAADFTGKVNHSEKPGAEFQSPRRKVTSIWTNDVPEDNHRFGCYGSEAEALTLSPMSSPKKTFDYSWSNISIEPLEEAPSVTETVRGCSRRLGAFLESTATSRSLSMVYRDVINNGPPQVRDSHGFTVPNRAPQKPMENCRRSVSDNCAPVSKNLSPASVFSPIKNRLRKRKWEQQGFNKATDANNGHLGPPQERRTSTFIEDYTHNIKCTQDFCRLEGCPGDQSEILHDTVFTPSKAPVEKRCTVLIERFPPMSPAKMFSYMKARESKREQLEVHSSSSSRRGLFGGKPDQSKNTLLAHSEMEKVASEKAQERLVPSHQCRADSADSWSETNLSEDTLVPAAPPQPVLLEDPLLLNSPKLSIPKKCEDVFKRSRWSTQKKFPVENVIYLKKWFLRKNSKGLFVDGIHREDNIPWNSNIIVDRVSNSVLKTVSGRVYILVGKMNINVASDFPKWFLKKFLNGFPPNWKALYEKFQSESKDRGVEKISEGKGIPVKTKPEASSVDHAVKRHRQKSLKTPESCPPTSSCSSTTTSRSGRVIKPPLEYWKGGRVILDAHMNVTIHEGYDTFISETSATKSPTVLQNSVRVFLPCNEGRKQSLSVTGKAASVSERKVKEHQKQDRTEVNPHKKPTYVSDHTVETLSSPEGCSGRITKSSRRRPYPAVDADVVPHKQSESEQSSAQTSKKKTHSKPFTRATGRRRAVTCSLESPPVSDGALEHPSSDDEVSSKGRKKNKEVPTKKGGKVHKSRSGRKQSSKQLPESSEEGRKPLKIRTKVVTESGEAKSKHKESERTETSPGTEPLPKLAQSSKKRHRKKGSAVIPREQHDDDDDDWSDAELKKLQEAVAFYPKHIAGYWAKVGCWVGTRSAEECHKQHTSQGASQTPLKKSRRHKTTKVEAPKPPVLERPVISARVGTLKRKQQVREFLETLPREDVDDAFSSAYMHNKRFEMPSMCPSDDHDFELSDLEPQTPMSSRFPEVKTPQCLHITPGMLGSPNANNGDKYVYQLQKRMKKSQFNVHNSSPTAKRFIPTPSVKRQIRCGNTENETFAVWEMFPGDDGGMSESGEEEDFYFSDD